jgi:hypothetical protein
MNLVNTTKLVAGYTAALDKTGREWLVVAAKGTYGIPARPDEEPRLLDEQVPLVMTDVFTGEPGFSAPLYENDFPPRKPRCDVLLNGSAYAPGGKPTERVTVSLRVGSLTKSFDVVGNRVWKAAALYMAASSPEPFTVMPISYNNAFGGVDKAQDDPLKSRYYLLNHAGVGYHEYTSGKFMDGKPLPNTEERGRGITNPKGSYGPMAFGPLGRAWQPRVKLAGTYDKNWLDNKHPFLPDDFQEAYYQAAPADQQMDYPQGGEEVELVNLTPQGRAAFRLPKVDIPVVFHLRNGERKETNAVLDTIVVEPDPNRFMLTWRASFALPRNVHDLREVVAGRVRVPDARSPSQGRGKRRFSSLAELAKSNRQTGRVKM